MANNYSINQNNKNVQLTNTDNHIWLIDKYGFVLMKMVHSNSVTKDSICELTITSHDFKLLKNKCKYKWDIHNFDDLVHIYSFKEKSIDISGYALFINEIEKKQLPSNIGEFIDFREIYNQVNLFSKHDSIFIESITSLISYLEDKFGLNPEAIKSKLLNFTF